MTAYGEIGHTKDDEFKIFADKVFRQMKKMHRRHWRQQFHDLTKARKDSERVRDYCMSRLKKEGFL